MAENKRYECIMLGHSQPLIQESLDKIGNGSRIVEVVSVGVNLMAIVENSGHAFEADKKVVNETGIGFIIEQNDKRRNHRKS